MSVEIVAYRTQFADSQGMCGQWDTPGLFLRDGTPTMDGTAFGESWQVQPSDPALFVDPPEQMLGACDSPIGGPGRARRQLKDAESTTKTQQQKQQLQSHRRTQGCPFCATLKLTAPALARNSMCT